MELIENEEQLMERAPIEIRNARYNHRGTIDVELNHPMFGWLPFTSDPDDVEPQGREIYALAIAGDVAPYVPPPPPTEEELRAMLPDLTARQFRLGLLQLGKLNAVAAAIELLPEPGRSTAKIEWEYATTFSRTNPLVQALIPLVGLTDAAVDALWPQMALV